MLHTDHYRADKTYFLLRKQCKNCLCAPLQSSYKPIFSMNSRCPSLLQTCKVGCILSLYTHCVREMQRRKDQRCSHKLNICFCPWSVFLDIFLSHMPFINFRTFKPIPPVFHCIILSCAKRMNAIYVYLEIKNPWKGCKGNVTTVIAKGLEQHWWNCCLNKEMW